MNIFKTWLNLFNFSVIDGDVATEVVAEEVVTDAPVSDGKEDADDYVEQSLKEFEQPKQEEAVKDEPVEKKEPAEKVEKKELSDEDLKPLKSGNKATDQRFEELKTSFKDVRAERDNYLTENTQLKEELGQAGQAISELQQLGFNDAEAGQSLIEFSEYRNALKSGNVEQVKKLLTNEIEQFELTYGVSLGFNVSGINQYQDLRQRVDNKELTHDDALRMARLNNLENRASIQSQINYEQQDIDRVLDTAMSDVTAFDKNMKNTDPDYATVIEAIAPYVAEIQKMHPSQWSQAIQMLYKSTKATAVKAQQQNRQNSFTPLRANSAKSGKPVFDSVTDQVSYDLSDENFMR